MRIKKKKERSFHRQIWFTYLVNHLRLRNIWRWQWPRIPLNLRLFIESLMNVNVLYILTRVCTFTSYWMWADQMIESNEKISRTFTHVSMNIYIYIFLSISCIFFQEPFYLFISYNNILCEYFSNIFSLYFLYLFYILSCTFIFSIVDLILRFEIILRKYYHIIEKRYMSEHSIPIFFHLHFSRAITFIGIKSMTSIVLERTFTIIVMHIKHMHII